MIESKDTVQQYKWGQDCDGWHFVNDKDLSVIQEKMPPHTFEVQHYHERSKQFFYILRGTALMKLENREVELHQGEGIKIHPGMVHQMCNTSEDDVEFLVISKPHSHQDRHLVKK
ncbi:cupin domain-containing protein [Ectobacillus polymachus]|uniref:cupin domain-containing protein n=1 Tax=Ectobacillus polymachus TaxID=1508806 RepID=UPI003A8486AD